ncbi:MAG: hypothetical protein M1819_000254 [Sarea resinae]|nr:MAG: hypothetical protein M1819_000254 [Sarea resinae]
MAATTSAPPGEQATAPPTFSYAQAAKGKSSSGSTTQSSKVASGTNGPSKEVKPITSPTSTAPSVNGASEGGDQTSELSNGVGGGQSTTSQPSQTKGTSSPPTGQTNGRSQNGISSPSSPAFGTSSTSTLPKEDDISCTPNLSSESTWDKQSQASVVLEKSSENGNNSAKDKEGEKEKATPKILKEAPPPAINFWLQRKEAQEAKTRVTLPAAPQVSDPTETEDGPTVRVAQDNKERTSDLVKPDSRKKVKPTLAGAEDPNLSQASAVKERKRPTERDGRARDETSRKLNPRSKTLERDSQRMSPSAPPPVEDAVSWPTPDSALGEEKKKVQDKGETTEKDRSPVRASGPRGKERWVPVPYTPTVVYNTPLPTAARRGGRTSRGGREAGGRGAAHFAHGSISSERSNMGPGATQQMSGQGEPNGRGRADGSTARTPSLPPKPKRASSAGPLPRREQRKYGQQTAPERRRDGESTFPKDGQNTASSSRRMSTATQTDGTQKLNPESRQFASNGSSANAPMDNANAVLGEIQGIDTHAHPKPNGPDRRLEGMNRPQEAMRDLGNNVPHREREREGRPDRGRGGFRSGRGASNGFNHSSQSPNSQFPNGHSPHQQHPASFSYPKTSTSYNTQQSHQSQYGPGPRNHRGGPRSQSIPHTAPLYGRFPVGMPNGPQQVAPLQTHMSNVYDYPMHSMSAVPYNPYVEQYSIVNMVAMQLDYYFSVDNLCKDMFLRKHMDSQGFVFLNVIADFNRIKQLTQDMELVRYVCFQSRTIEFRTGPDGLDRLRRREGWQQWVLSKDERDPSAQNDGPVQIHQPRTPHPQGLETSYMEHGRQNMSPNELGQNLDHDGAYQHIGGVVPNYVPLAPVPTMSGSVSGNSHPDFTPLSAAVPDFAPSGVPNEINGQTNLDGQRSEGDSFPDEQIPHLMIIVRKPVKAEGQLRRPFHSAASRTFSNGSIDGRTIADEMSHPRPMTNGATPDSSEAEKHVGPKHSKPPHHSDPQVFWVKEKDTPIDALPEDLTVESYHTFRKNAMEQRESSAADQCHRDMNILYQFWSHFLIRNFNSRMYGEFRQTAFEDAQKKSEVGIQNLIQYYDQALHSQKTISNDIARDYVELVRNEDADKERPGFDKLRAAWRNGALNMKNRKKVDNVVDKELRAQLES